MPLIEASPTSAPVEAIDTLYPGSEGVRMPLPGEWANVDWRPTVILLPDTTEGIRTQPLNRDKYPQHPRGYFMMATTDQHGQLIYYNAADVGEAGPLVSQFVFWHEMGHFHLGHVAAVPGQILQGVSPVLGGSGNRETDADLFAYHYWKKQRSMHGIRVIESVIEYLERQGNAPGDAEHPPPRDRANLLRVYLDNSLWKIVIHNDDTTSPEFVYGVLTDDFKLKRESAIEFITKVESDGKGSIRTIGEPTSRLHAWTHSITKTKAELLVMDIRLRAMLAGHFQFRLEAKPL